MRQTLLLLLMLLACAWFGGAQGASGQTARRAPDAIILVQPSADRAYVSVTFSRYLTREEVKQYFARLRAAVGWTSGAIDVFYTDSATGDKAPAAKREGVWTEVAALLSSAPQVRDRAFVLQPFIDAFADLNSFNLLYMVGKARDFAGLRSYRSTALDVTLINDGGPYKYAVDIKDHTGPLPRLPLTEASAAAAPVASNAGRGVGIVSQLAVVVLCAGVVALVAFVVVSRAGSRGSRPAARRN